MDETMDTEATENQLLSTPAEQINEQTEGEEPPSTDMPLDEEEMIPMPAMEVFDWNTSLVSQVSMLDLNEASLDRCLCSSVEKAISIVYGCLSSTVNKCQLVAHMHRPSPIIWKWKLDSHHCTMLHVIND